MVANNADFGYQAGNLYVNEDLIPTNEEEANENDNSLSKVRQ